MRVDGLTKEFVGSGLRRPRVRAVDRVSFELHRGEVLAVIGESGCGKSTLARLLTRLMAPSAGSVRLGDVDLTRLRGEPLRVFRQRIQPISQDAEGSLDPRMRVRDLLVEPLRSFGRPADDETVRDLAGSASLTPDLLDRHPHQLSGGQRQRLGFARALCLEPEVVVADEPAASLDPSTQAALLLELQRRQLQRGMALVLITHNLRHVRLVADRVAVMELGRIVEIGPTEQVFDSPRHPCTKAIMAAVDVLAGRKHDERRTGA